MGTGGGDGGVRYAALSDDDDDDAEKGVSALLGQFVADEPALSACRLDPDVLLPALRQWTRALLQSDDDCSMAAYDSADGTLAGVSLNFLKLLKRLTGVSAEDGDSIAGGSVVVGQSADDSRSWLAHHWPDTCIQSHEGFIRLLEGRAATRRVARAAEATPTVGDRCGRCFQVGILVCRRDYRGRGVARGLVERSISLAKSMGCEVVLATAFSVYSQRIFETLGFLADAEASYDEHPFSALFGESEKKLHRAVVAYSKRL